MLVHVHFHTVVQAFVLIYAHHLSIDETVIQKNISMNVRSRAMRIERRHEDNAGNLNKKYKNIAIMC